MNKAAVIIGVDRVGGLPVLQGAATGAREFATWAEGQGFETHLLTDAGTATVGLADIKHVIRTLVEARNCEQLLIHFSGHGILRSAESELWLLSGAPDDPDEAVNVAGSIWSARNSGISHVVFISDACRSRPDTSKQSQVTGGVIFPSRDPHPPRPAVDQFYATLPGDTALEVPAATSTAGYRALFTEYLLKGLRAQGPDLVEPMVLGATVAHVIPAWRLKPYLEREVPAAAARVHIRLQQDPEIRVESHPPRFLARITPADAPVAGTPPPPAPRAGRLAPPSDLGELRRSEYFGEPGPRKTAALRRADGLGLQPAMERVRRSRGRVSFETRTGFTVVGTSVVHADVSMGHCDVFAEDSPSDLPNQVRVYPVPGTESPGSALIQFADGTGTCLAILPGFIGTVLVEEGAVVNVSYTPARGTTRYHEYVAFEERIEARRALFAVHARKGVLRIEPEEAARYGDSLREFKALDPTLGLYAAYAYAQGGMIDEVRSVARYMEEDGLPPLFDIAVLSHRLTAGDLPRLVPFRPMLTQGWALLDAYEGVLSAEERSVSRQLLPALWTTLTTEGLGMLGQLLRLTVHG